MKLTDNPSNTAIARYYDINPILYRQIIEKGGNIMDIDWWLRQAKPNWELIAKVMYMYADHQRDMLMIARTGLIEPDRADDALDVLTGMGIDIPLPYRPEDLGITPDQLSTYKTKYNKHD